MVHADRLKAASSAALKHLLISLAVAAAVAWLVFALWYPAPFWQLAGGQELFLLIISIDVVCGPLLTLIVYNPRKPRAELVRDLGLVVLIQLAALGYGLSSLWQARPLYLAFEGDRFRVVSAPDVLEGESALQPPRSLMQAGPALTGVSLLQPGDPGHLQSLEMAMNGIHPAFRPSRWVSYEQQRALVVQRARPAAQLAQQHGATGRELLDGVARSAGLPVERLGYLPLVARHRDDWSLIIDLETARPVGHVPLSAW